MTDFPDAAARSWKSAHDQVIFCDLPSHCSNVAKCTLERGQCTKVLARMLERYDLSTGSYNRPRMTIEFEEAGIDFGEREG